MDLAGNVPANSTFKSVNEALEKILQLEQELSNSKAVKGKLEEEFTRQLTQNSILQNQLKELSPYARRARVLEVENKQLKEKQFYSRIMLNDELEQD